MDRPSHAMKPSPAAAASDPVTVLPRKVSAAHVVRESQARRARGHPAADRHRFEQDGRVDPADRDGQHHRDRQHQADGRDLGRQERSPRHGLGQDERGRAPIPFRGDGAHRQDDGREGPELGEVLPELEHGIPDDRLGDLETRQLVATSGLDDLGEELGEQG